MKTKIILFNALLGLVAGSLSCVLLQGLLLLYQTQVLPLFDIFVYQGMLIGASFGILLINQDVLYYRNWKALQFRSGFGFLYGALSGGLAFLIGQSLLGANRFIPFLWVRMLSWSLLGLCLGIAFSLMLPKLARHMPLIGFYLFASIAAILGHELCLWLLPMNIATTFGLLLMGVLFFSVAKALELRKVKAYLMILTGYNEGEIYYLQRPQLTVGYHHDNDVVLKGYTEICKKHAVLVHRKQQYEILNTQQGGQVLVNYRIIEQQEIKNGDIIKIGSALVQFHEAAL